MIIREEVLNMINSGTYISTTRAGADTFVLSSTLTPGASYLITDPIDGGQILLKAGTVNTFEPNGTWYKTNEFRAYGFFRLSGVAGSVNTVNVAAVNQLTGVIPFNVTAYQTLVDVATNINANGGRVVNAVVCRGDVTLDQPYIVLERLVGGVNTDTVTATTTTLVADDVNNMSQGAVSTNVVYDIEFIFGASSDTSRVVRCYDPINLIDVRTAYGSTYNSISGVDNTGTKKPGFFRWGSVYAKQSTIGLLSWDGMFVRATVSGIIQSTQIFGGIRSLLRGIVNFNLITTLGSIFFQDCTSGSGASLANIQSGAFLQNFLNQSFGNMQLTGNFTGLASFTTRVTHAGGTTRMKFNSEQTNITIITGVALGSSLVDIRTGRNAVFNITYGSSGSNSLGKIDIGGGGTFSLTHTGIGGLTNTMTGITVGKNANLTMTIDGTATSTIQRTVIGDGVSCTYVAPGVSLDDHSVTNQPTAISITSANKIDLSDTIIDNTYCKKFFTQLALTGAANNGLSGSPILLGNLLDNFWATNTVWEATGLTGVGALLQLGIETDDDDAMIPATAIAVLTDRLVFNSPVNTQSTAVDRRLIATPTVATITAGQFTGYVEGQIGF